MNIPTYPQSGFPVDASWGRGVIDCLRALRVRSGRGIRVTEGPDGTIIEAPAQPIPPSIGSGVDLSKLCFGYKIVGSSITITSGEITVGDKTHILPDWTCPINVDFAYVGVEYNATAAAYIGPSDNVDIFRNGDGKIRCWFHQFRYVAPVAPATVGSVSWLRTGRLLNISDPGNFA